MDMEIIYGDTVLNSGRIIKEYSKSQALQSDFYEKITKESGLFKQIETYSIQNLIALLII